MQPTANGVRTDVLVAMHPDQGDRALDHRRLAILAAALAPRAASAHPEPPSITHHCPACGSTEHGRPVLVGADGRVASEVHLSLSRAGGWVALAATLAGPVGIDLESPIAVAAAGFDDIAFDADEQAAIAAVRGAHGPARADRMRALAWSAKEAVLKALGTGLRTDPRAVPLNLTAPAPTLPTAPDPAPTLRATLDLTALEHAPAPSTHDLTALNSTPAPPTHDLTAPDLTAPDHAPAPTAHDLATPDHAPAPTTHDLTTPDHAPAPTTHDIATPDPATTLRAGGPPAIRQAAIHPLPDVPPGLVGCLAVLTGAPLRIRLSGPGSAPFPP